MKAGMQMKKDYLVVFRVATQVSAETREEAAELAAINLESGPHYFDAHIENIIEIPQDEGNENEGLPD